MKNILELLENSTSRFPDKTAFADTDTALTFSELRENAARVGTALSKSGVHNAPIAVLLPKSTACLTAMLGVTYSGNFYVVLDTASPNERLDKILDTLRPTAVITDEAHLEKANSFRHRCHAQLFSELSAVPENPDMLRKIRDKAVDTDPLYALFTSGSTGNPKGAIVTHRNVLNYSEWFVKAFGIDENTVFGNQTPFYFSMSVSDVFATLRAGATLHIIPKTDFSFPMKLLEFLNARKVNTIYWVPSALCILANWKVFSYGTVETLKKVLFAGEVMPMPQLNYWRGCFPDALFANLFGPTETTDICTYYVVNRAFPDTATLPIGKACDNCEVFIVKEDGTQAREGESGELFVRGGFLAAGYYDNPEKTASAFVQNPLNPHYPETVYRTGDLVRYNEYGELEYLSRKDFQIKHMGYRIELGEIEAAAFAVEKLSAACAVYDSAKDRIVLIYTGRKLTPDALREALASRLPAYMQPNLLIPVKDMPYNANGKIDRAKLKNDYQSLLK